MAIKRINSKIKKYFSDELLNKIKTVYKSVVYYEVSIAEFNRFPVPLGVNEDRILDYRPDGKVRIKLMSNNTRMNLIKNFIRMEWADKIINFGTGTNRLAVMTESLVFKIAIDQAGCVDNLHEFYMSAELYPDVTKSYETNELILVSEYVNVIKTKEEFDERQSEIIHILRDLEDRTSLMLDVGFIAKNRTNWGIRTSDNRPVILDFAYIYTKLPGIQLSCASSECKKKHGLQMLKYTENYSAMQCPACKRTYGPASFQRMISTDLRKEMYQGKLDDAYKVSKAVTYFEIDEYGDYKEVEADDSMISYEIDKSNAKEIEADYISASKEYERQMSFNGFATKEITNLKETLRRSLLEVRHGKNYEELDSNDKFYDPYNDLREEVDLVRLTGIDQIKEEKRRFEEAKQIEIQAKIKARQDFLNNLNKENKNNERCVENMNMDNLYNGGRREKEMDRKTLDNTLDALVKITGADIPVSTPEGQILRYAAERDYDEDEDFQKKLVNIADELSGELEEKDPIQDDEYNIDMIDAIMSKKPLPTKECHGDVLSALDRYVENNPEEKHNKIENYWNYEKPVVKQEPKPQQPQRKENILDKYEKILDSDDKQSSMEKLADKFTDQDPAELEAMKENFEDDCVDLIANIMGGNKNKPQRQEVKPQQKQQPVVREKVVERKVVVETTPKHKPMREMRKEVEKDLAKELASKVSERKSMEKFIDTLSSDQQIMLLEILNQKLMKKVDKNVNKVKSEIKKDVKVEPTIPVVEAEPVVVEEVKTEVIVNPVVETIVEPEVKVEPTKSVTDGYACHPIVKLKDDVVEIDKYDQEFRLEVATEVNTVNGITVQFEDTGITTSYNDVASQSFPTSFNGMEVKGFTFERELGEYVIRLHRDTDSMYYHEGLKAYFPCGLQESDIPNSFERYSNVAIRCCECYNFSKVRQLGTGNDELVNMVDNNDDIEELDLENEEEFDAEAIQNAMMALEGEDGVQQTTANKSDELDSFIEDAIGEFDEFDTEETFEKISKKKEWK